MDPVPPTTMLVLPDGRQVRLDSDVVIGRAPVPPPESPEARPVSVEVATVSKTHALIGCTPSSVWIVDLESSNGSEIIDSSGRASRIVPGVRSLVPTRCHIRLGTEAIVTVEQVIDEPAVPVDDDITVERPVRASASVVPEQPGRDGKPLPPRSPDVDWSVPPAPAPGLPTPRPEPRSDGELE
jgi:pSer/pThr/pTyr-binding forkhead associated (FHA) protein